MRPVTCAVEARALHSLMLSPFSRGEKVQCNIHGAGEVGAIDTDWLKQKKVASHFESFFFFARGGVAS